MAIAKPWCATREFRIPSGRPATGSLRLRRWRDLAPSVRRAVPGFDARAVIRFVAAAVFSFAVVAGAAADDLESLARDGYGVLDTTVVPGEFKGCDAGSKFPFENGLVFECSEHHFADVFEPEVLILKNVRTGKIKVLIDGDEFEGSIFRR